MIIDYATFNSSRSSLRCSQPVSRESNAMLRTRGSRVSLQVQVLVRSVTEAVVKCKQARYDC